MLLLPRLALTALVLAAIATAEDQGDQTGRILLPKDWRHFMHIKTMVIQPGNPLFEAHGGLHNVYGNGKAVGVLQAGGTAYPDGAVLVLDLHEVIDADHALTAGARRQLAVMVKDSHRFAATGGWGYQAWAEGDEAKPQVTTPGEPCAPCHSQAAATGSVFSSWQP